MGSLCHMKPFPSTTLLLALLLGSCASQEFHAVAEDPVLLSRNGEAVFAEEAGLDAELDASMQAWLVDLKLGMESPRRLVADHPRRFAFWYRSLQRVAGPHSRMKASLLKCYPLEDGSYLISLVFQEKERIEMILEVQATPEPRGDGFVFGCPFENNTAHLQVTPIGEVVFHHSSPLESSRAQGFDDFRSGFVPSLDLETGPLHYYCLDTLEDLLACYGVVFDTRKCNWLAQDLGFLDDEGRRFITGTGNPDYRFGFLQYALPRTPGLSEELPLHFVVGIATYFGGYGLSGDTLPTLKRQFREALVEDPEMDFLVEFRKKRGASIERHFTYFVISAFLFEEAVDRVGLESAMDLARCGEGEEEFFTNLQLVFGVTESGFHDLIVELIQA